MLDAGTKLGPYEITSPIGAGGMGEVYKARDTRLDRTVAIKILPEHLADSPERRERFERESRAVSALNHPHICTLHDVGSQDGIDYIVMEYLEGETLADRLKKGSLRFEDSIRYGQQIANALDAAHRHGVVHRDLKPGNIMLTKQGAVLLDFGLAKRTTLADASDGSDSAQPTQAKDLTDERAVLGTFQYMAPEQLEGGEIDARIDIFAFGAVLYEMLTGKKAFTGTSQASLIGAILKDDPPAISSLKPTSPPELDRVLKKCLAKNADERWASLHDVTELLSWVGTGTTETSFRFPAKHGAWILAAISGWAMAVGVYVWTRPVLTEARYPIRFSIDINREVRAQLTANGAAVTVSPSGRTVVFPAFATNDAGPSRLYAHDIASSELRALAGTEGALVSTYSPDGEWIAFLSTLDRNLKKVQLNGGAPRTITQLETFNVRGMSWGENGFLYFNHQPRGIFRVHADGGEPELLLAPNPDDNVKTHRLPNLLPGDRHLLFVTGYANMDSYDEATISVLTLATGDVKVLIEGGSNPLYAASGHIIYGRDGAIMAAPFDLDRLAITGQPTPVLSGVVTSQAWGVGQFALSDTGTLAYLPGKPQVYYPTLTWVDRTGRSEPFAITARDFREVRFSPDGHKLAFRESKGNDDVWTYDILRGTLTRVTSRWDNAFVAWAPDGRSVLYNALSPGPGVVRKAADGTGSEEILLRVNANARLGNVSSDGRELLYDVGGDIWSLRLEGDAAPTVVIGGQFNETLARFSPDGQWIAYASDESGRSEVYIQPHSGPGNRTLVSTGGGDLPTWRGDGRELFFYGEGAIQSVAIRTEPELDVGAPIVLFERSNVLDYDVSPDGNRFLIIERDPGATPTEIRVVVNWFEELNRLAPPPQ